MDKVKGKHANYWKRSYNSQKDRQRAIHGTLLILMESQKRTKQHVGEASSF